MKDRTDPHRPSVMDPAEYVFVGAADDHPGDSYLEVRHDVLARHGIETGVSDRYSSTNVPFYDAQEDGRPNFRCHHCGKHGSNIRYFVFFLHKPSKQVIVVGQICARKLNLASKADLDFQKRAERYRLEQSRHQWVQDHQPEFTYLEDYDTQHAKGGYYSEFLESLWDQVQRKSFLSDKQLAALQQNMERTQARDGDRHQGQVVLRDARPTEKQMNLINSLCDQLGCDKAFVEQIKTRIEASACINRLKGELQDRKPQEPSATPAQTSYIHSLMDQKEIGIEKRQKAEAMITAGLTRAQASQFIDKLLTYPDLEDA